MENYSEITRISTQDRIERIDQLDLEPILIKLMDKEDGEGWAFEQALAGERIYKQFLILNLKFSDEHSIVPTKTIDTVWHYHILDTKKYANDCDFCFGYFVHHFPYFGMRGDTDETDLENAFQKTAELYLTEFGITVEESHKDFNPLSAKCDGSTPCKNNCGSCRNQCGKCEPGKAENSIEFETRPSFTIEQKLLRVQLTLD